MKTAVFILTDPKLRLCAGTTRDLRQLIENLMVGVSPTGMEAFKLLVHVRYFDNGLQADEYLNRFLSLTIQEKSAFLTSLKPDWQELVAEWFSGDDGKSETLSKLPPRNMPPRLATDAKRLPIQGTS